MADYSRRERTVTTVEYLVPTREPWGACWVEVMKAIHAATAELRELGRLGPTEEPADDMIRLHAGDEDIVVTFDRRGA